MNFGGMISEAVLFSESLLPALNILAICVLFFLKYVLRCVKVLVVEPRICKLVI